MLEHITLKSVESKITYVLCLISSWILLTTVASAEANNNNNNRIKEDFSSVKSTYILDRLEASQQAAQSTANTKVGLSALKELLFDDMVLFSIIGALVLLVALVGAAVIISKRKDIH